MSPNVKVNEARLDEESTDENLSTKKNCNHNHLDHGQSGKSGYSGLFPASSSPTMMMLTMLTFLVAFSILILNKTCFFSKFSIHRGKTLCFRQTDLLELQPLVVG